MHRHWSTKDNFAKFAKRVALLSGHPLAFTVSFFIIVGWAACGSLFHFSDTWQLVINTGTTIVTFLMVFLIQNTQNRDSHAIHLKLDELIRSQKEAHTALMDIEELSDEELEAIRCRYAKLAQRGRVELRKGHSDKGVPEIRVAKGGRGL